MDTNNIRNLIEAYQHVYAPQEVDEATAMAKRGYDETQLRKRAGGGEAADRASALENRPTYGDKSKEAQRSRYARAQRGDFRKTASSNPGLHVGQHKSNDPAVKAKQAARGAQRGALTPNERKQLNMGDETPDIFDLVLEFLYVEGYAETMEEAEWMMANIIDEEAIEIIVGEAFHPIYGRGGAQRRTQTPKQIGVRGAAHNIPKGGTTIGPSDPGGQKLGTGEYDRGKGSKAARRAKGLREEEEIEIIVGEEQLNEISLKTKMSAFKKRATHDFESDSDSDNYTKSGENKTDKIKANIVKKHGAKAGAHAERAAHAGIFGRKSFSMPKKPN